jgi:hypothetical protein
MFRIVARTARAYRLHMLKRWATWPRDIQWLTGIAAVALALVIVWVLFVPAADRLAHHDVGSAQGPLLQSAGEPRGAGC